MSDEVATELRHEAARVLRPLADLAAPVAPGAEPSWDQLVRVREHDAARAAQCGAALAYDGDFDGWRAAFARRRLGRAVLERWRRGATLDPGALAAAVVEDAAREGRDSLGQWLATLRPGGRAAVVRDAAAFAASARAELRAWPPAAGTHFGLPYAWDLSGRAVRLEATADAVTRPTRSLLQLATTTLDRPSTQREMAWLAVVATLATGQLPGTVTRIDLTSGDRCTVAVTDDVLDTGLTSAAAAVEAAIAARFTAPLEPVPGRWCSRCRGVDRCLPGGSWLMARPGHFRHPV
jgi:hypothetical protein